MVTILGKGVDCIRAANSIGKGMQKILNRPRKRRGPIGEKEGEELLALKRGGPSIAEVS